MQHSSVPARLMDVGIINPRALNLDVPFGDVDIQRVTQTLSEIFRDERPGAQRFLGKKTGPTLS